MSVLVVVAAAVQLIGEFCTPSGCTPSIAQHTDQGQLEIMRSGSEPLPAGAVPGAFVSRDGDFIQLGVLDDSGAFQGETGAVRARVSATTSAASLRAVRAGDELEWTAPLRGIGDREVRIILPPGEYQISFAADGYRTADLGTVQVRAGDEIAANVHFARRVDLTGSVRSARTGEPVPDVALETTDGHELARSDEKGDFRLDVSEFRPSTIVLRGDGFGPRRVTVETGATDLGRIDLYEGETMFLLVRHPSAEEPLPLGVSLARQNGSRWERDSRSWEGTSGEVIELANLVPGNYRVTIRGPEPLQQTSDEAEVVGGIGADLAINLSPRSLRGTVSHGDLPLPEASIQIKSSEDWEAHVSSDEYGEFGSELWGAETLAFAVSGGPLKTPYFTMIETGDADPLFVDIAVPHTRLLGLVLDDGTRKPIADATVNLESLEGEISFRQAARTNTEGEFEFTGVMAGEHGVRAQATGYLPYETSLETERTDDEKRIDLMLKRGRSINVQLRDSAGNAISGAHARGITPDGFRPLGTVFTDASGSAVITIAHDEHVEILSFQPGGSFTFSRLSPDSPESVVVTLPPATSELRLRTVDEEGNPMPGTGFFVRYNGSLVPFQTWISVLNSRGLAPRTDGNGDLRLSNLPAGIYEVFHFSGSNDLGARLASHRSLPASARLELLPGTATTAVFVVESEEP